MVERIKWRKKKIISKKNLLICEIDIVNRHFIISLQSNGTKYSNNNILQNIKII